MQLMPAALAAIIFGLVAATYFPIPQVAGWLLAGVTLAGAFLGRRCKWLSLALLLLFFFLFSLLRYPLAFPDNRALISLTAAGRKLTVSGKIIAVRQYADGRTSLDLQPVRIEGLSPDPVAKRMVSLRLYLEQGSDQLLPGDWLKFRSRLRVPRLFGIPGEFNRPRYLASQGIAVTAWVKTAEELEVTGYDNDFPNRWIGVWRRRLAGFIRSCLPPEQSGMVRALVLGESRMLPDAVRKNLAMAGISHLFAISGLHLGLLAFFAYRLLLPIYRRSIHLMLWQPPQRILPLLLLPLLLGYLLLTGDAVATRRAFCLAAIGGGLLCWRQLVNPLMLLVSLALLFLLTNPLLLWQPGWQLSFAGAAGILFWRRLWQAQMGNVPTALRFVIRLLLVTCAASLATLPLVLSNFHLFSAAGLPANLVSVPLVAFLALPVGLTGLLLYNFSPVLAASVFKLCGLLLEVVLVCVNHITALPGMQGKYLFLNPWQYLAIALFLLPVLLWPVSLGRRRYLAGSMLVFVLAVLCWCCPFFRSPQFRLTMFSVGQGESLLLSNDSGQAILVDGGGLYSDRFDVGERLLAPALGYLGIRELSAVLLTHNHPDHRKGLAFILQQFPVKQFWSGPPLSDLPTRLRTILQDKAVPYFRVPPGWLAMDGWNHGTIRLFSGVENVSNENNRSVVLYWQKDGQGVLLTGDLEAEGVEALLASGFSGPVSLLKLPHHGSRYSQTQRLVRLFKPKICLVSAGFRNRYHLPATELVTFLKKKGVPLYRTDLQGTVQAALSDKGWAVSRWENGFYH